MFVSPVPVEQCGPLGASDFVGLGSSLVADYDRVVVSPLCCAVVVHPVANALYGEI